MPSKNLIVSPNDWDGIRAQLPVKSENNTREEGGATQPSKDKRLPGKIFPEEAGKRKLIVMSN